MLEALDCYELSFAKSNGTVREGGTQWSGVAGLSSARSVSLTGPFSLASVESSLRSENFHGETWLIRPISGFPEREVPTQPFVELRIQTVYNFSLMDYCRGEENFITPTLLSAGAHPSNLFEIVVGPARPTVITFVGWDSLQQMHDGWKAVDVSHALQEKQDRARSKHGRTLEEGLAVSVLQRKGDSDG